MAYHKYQVTFDETGEIVKTVQLPDEPARLRTIIVREETEHKAKRVAQDLYSLST